MAEHYYCSGRQYLYTLSEAKPTILFSGLAVFVRYKTDSEPHASLSECSNNNVEALVAEHYYCGVRQATYTLSEAKPTLIVGVR